MSLQRRAEALRQKIDDLLVVGGAIAVPILRVVNDTADWCPPLKIATGSALSILDEVQGFKDNKNEWASFGQHIVDTVAEVILAIKSYDPSVEEAKPWVESIAKLDGALQKIKSEIERRLKKIEKRPTFINAWSYLRDPGRIDDLKKDFDNALISFQLRMSLIGGAKLAAMECRLWEDKILDRLRFPHIAQDDSTQACLGGTRAKLTEHIMTWCHNTGESENRLMLLTAVAGAGKTSITLTIAERCASEEGITLLLHFFFKAGERSRPDFLFSGIARALAERDPVYRTLIISALRKDSSLPTAPLAKQFKHLVASPLLHKPPPPSHPMVVIIDALDECDREAFEPLAEILREEVPKLPSSTKFFITSRQFNLVTRFLSPNYPIVHLTIDLSDETNIKDCTAYIRSQLQKLREVHPDLRCNLQDEDKSVQEISERANGLFIWISTIFRYMKMTSEDPMGTLKSLLDTSAKRSKVPAEEMMDHLYTNILKRCNWKIEGFVHDYPIVMGAIFVARQPLSIASWERILLPFLKSPVQYTLAELAPLLLGVENPHIPVRISHQSFRDFVLHRLDPGSIDVGCSLVNVKTENARVALQCTKILNHGLSFVKGLGWIDNMSEKDEMPHFPPEDLSEHFHYACRHIVHHLSGVQEPSEELAGSIGMFLSHKAACWVEVCVRMEGYISISSLPEWAKSAVLCQSKDAVHALANVLIRLQRNLKFFSRFQEAYEAADDSVILCRDLVSLDPRAYTPDLAKSLNSLYNALYNLGRHSEALPFIKESLNLYCQLVVVHPGLYIPDLAKSLNSLYNALSNLGQHSEALPYIENSVKLRHQLAVINPGLYTLDLARSLSSLCNALSNLGRHSEALPFIEESVELGRQLVAVHPGSYIPDLARSLNNLYITLSSLGRHLEALPFIEERVKLYRQLVAIHPVSYTPGLAGSLLNLYLALSRLGQCSKALQLIEESVKLYRQLVAVHPGSYTPNLALSLNNLYVALSNLGRHPEALPFIEESVKLYCQLVTIHPGSYTPDLAMSLNNLYIALSNLGQHLEALPFIEESVKLYRQLVPIHPGSCTPGLARSLLNLYTALSELGQHSEALPFIEESVKLYCRLVAMHPGSYVPDLAASLNNLYTALSKLGRHSEAFLFIEECVQIWHELVAVNPRAHAPGLANSLKNLHSALSNLGHHSEAL
ncbi:uncharacterized protein EI90DRAFT_3136697 [Cantharellus anzutake]|uniref:uncharacterized protein n=1 Tax=Cantharellus anzutake TaxID=1750568 RepID=UPI0019074D50|nr:uncharacterized protein EI90DRAFT_3136697 [Cantharellus anzutake]KAF8313354.1 hypothetical protein EI90DRAFT_3136697 [Cantharellus anzutake]